MGSLNVRSTGEPAGASTKKADDRRSRPANGSSDLSFFLPIHGHAENFEVVLSQSCLSSLGPILSYWKNRKRFITGWTQIMA